MFSEYKWKNDNMKKNDIPDWILSNFNYQYFSKHSRQSRGKYKFYIRNYQKRQTVKPSLTRALFFEKNKGDFNYKKDGGNKNHHKNKIFSFGSSNIKMVSRILVDSQ